MSALHKLAPITLLRELEARSKYHAVGLPLQIETRDSWTGVAFRVENFRFVASLEDVGEILVIPVLTRVPGAQAWVRGLANVRGTLLPVMDLRYFFDGGRIQLQRQTRMLILRNQGLVAGLMVDEVYGMRHFQLTERIDELPNEADFMKDYVEGAYQKNELHWGIFNINKITSSKAYHMVAARTTTT